MKRILSLITILSVLSLTGFAKAPVAKGKTHCCLGTYVVEKAIDPISVDGKAIKTFIVSYENSDLTVKIGVDKSDKKCIKYIVVSDDLQIQYDCNRQYFGVSKLDKKYLDDGFATSDINLDRRQYFYQKCITQDNKNEIDHVKLISVYFPKLVKDYEKVFAVK
jgi:hypothetical protein